MPGENKIVRSIENMLSMVGYGALLLMMVLGAFDVVGRYLFNRPIFGALEISKSLLTVVVVLVWAKALAEGKHIKVDIIANYFPIKFKSVLDIVFTLLTLGLFVLIAWQTASFGATCWKQNRTVETVHFPLAIMYYIICLGASATCIELCLSLYLSIKAFLRKSGGAAPDVKT